MGRFPDPHYQENAANENAEVLVTGGDIPEQKSPTPMKQTNCVNEVKDRQVFGGDI
jgi:hypothetical protein